MAVVSQADREAMIRLKAIMEGKPIPKANSMGGSNSNDPQYVELHGAGVVTQRDIDAMASVMNRFNAVSESVVDNMVSESSHSPYLAEALSTERNSDGIKIGKYQISIKEDRQRLAGKQFYSIYNSTTNDVIADDISLYETALAVVRLLNNGKYANSSEVRKLFEHDDAYTSHRVDALLYKRRINKSSDPVKTDIYESRFQASVDKCMAAKKAIKILAK